MLLTNFLKDINFESAYFNKELLIIYIPLVTTLLKNLIKRIIDIITLKLIRKIEREDKEDKRRNSLLIKPKTPTPVLLKGEPSYRLLEVGIRRSRTLSILLDTPLNSLVKTKD